MTSVNSVAEVAALNDATTEVFVHQLSDTIAQALCRLKSLRTVGSDGNPSGLTDDGLESLGSLTNLESLCLEWATFSDAGLRQLSALKSLRFLDLGFCEGFSEAGLKALRLNLPGCEIDRDGARTV